MAFSYKDDQTGRLTFDVAEANIVGRSADGQTVVPIFVDGVLVGGSGMPGPKGDKGDKGDPGPEGPKGDKGDKGDTGLNGSPGADGSPGPKGDKGDTGATGPQGPAGADGTNGAPGAKGDKGDKGDTGDSSHWLTGTVAPNDGAVGQIHDMYLNTATGDVYGPKLNTGWGAIKGNIKGPAVHGAPVPTLTAATNMDFWAPLAPVIEITGTTGIGYAGVGIDGQSVIVLFNSATPLFNSGVFVIPGLPSSFTTAPGDSAEFVYVASTGVTKCVNYTRNAQRIDLGTGAYGTITTSTTDPTIGRLLKVGDYGIGTQLAIETIDANTLLTAQDVRYLSPSSPNIPPWANIGGFLSVIAVVGAGPVLAQQEFWELQPSAGAGAPAPRTWSRSYRNTGWTDWGLKPISGTKWSIYGSFNANTLIYPGVSLYVQGSTGVNLPLALNGWLTCHYAADTASSARLQQTFTPYEAAERVPREYVRYRLDTGTWTAWVRSDIGGVFSGIWNNVTASRALGTTYTNTRGKPIQVTASAINASAIGTSMHTTVGGVLAGRGGYSTSLNQTVNATSIIVPDGATYSIATVGGTATLNDWKELY